MSKEKLLASVDGMVESLFSSPDTYNSVKIEAIAAYDKYRVENNLDEDFTVFYDFIFMYVMKHSIRTSMRQTIDLLGDSGLLDLSE